MEILNTQDLKFKRIKFLDKETLSIICLLIAEGSEKLRLLQIIYGGSSYIFLFYVIVKYGKRLAYAATRDIFLILLILLAIASVLWSENPSSTIYKAKFLLRSVMFGAYLAIRYTPRKQLLLLSWTASISMVINLAFVLLFPEQSIQETNGVLSWKGIFSHKQQFGAFMGFASSIFLVNYFDKGSRKLFTLVRLGLALVMILLAASKTALIIFVFSLALIPLYKIIQQRKYRGFLLFITLVIFSAIAILIEINLQTIVVDVLGKNVEFNGRTPIWSLAIEQGLKQPWFGYGYNGFWTSEVSSHIINSTWAGEQGFGFGDNDTHFHAHNDFIDLFLQLGLVGLLLFIISFFICLHRIISLSIFTQKIEYFWMFQFIGIFLINSMSNGMTILGTDEIFSTLYLLIVFSSAVEYRRFKRNLVISAS